MMFQIGFGAWAKVEDILAVDDPLASPIKRLISQVKEKDPTLLLDHTHGRRTRSVLICNNGYILLTSLSPESICRRMNHATDGLVSVGGTVGGD